MVTAPAALLRDDDPLTHRLVRARPGSVLPAVGVLVVAGLAAAVVAAAGEPRAALLPLTVAVAAGTWSAASADRRWSWVVPALLRAAEYGTVLTVGVVVEDAGPATYAALAALAYRHYDLVYRGRALGPGAVRTVASDLLGGWQGRTVVVVVGSGLGVAAAVLWAVAAVVVVVALTDTTVAWRPARARRFAGADVDDEEAW